MVRRRLRRHRRVMFGDPGTAPSLVEGGGGDVGFAAAQGLSGAVVAAREEDSFADRVLSVWDSRLMVGRWSMRCRHMMFGDWGRKRGLVEGGSGNIESAAAGGRSGVVVPTQGLSGAVVAAREEDSFANRVMSVGDSRLMVGRRSMRCRHVMFRDRGRKRGLIEGGGGNIESAAAGGRSGVVVAARKVDHFGIIRVWLVWNGILMVQSSLMWRRRVMFIVIPVAMIGEHVDNSKKECSFLALLQNI
jgi:hypothetical protein